MGALILAIAAGLVAGLSAAAPWLIYAGRIVPRLEGERARAAAYVVAAIPAILASAATYARLAGITTGSLERDVAAIAVIVGIACTWAPIVRGALLLTGGAEDSPIGAVQTRGAVARTGGYLLALLLVARTVVWFAAPAYSAWITCMDAGRIVAEADTNQANTASIADALPWTPPESGALFIIDLPQNLDQTASSKHDPATRDQLVEAGFVGGQLRSWYASDGRDILASVIEFGTPEGAAAYHAQVTQHACQFANEAFAAPMNGIGLQVRYGSGDPIVEQVSWVAGNRRYLVSVSELAPPPDHHRVLGILDAATAIWPVGGPAPDPSPQPSPDPTSRAVTDPEVIARGLDNVGAALEATLGEGTAWINRHIVFTGSSEFSDGATAFAGGQLSLQEARKMRMMVQYAEISDTEANSAEVIADGSLALIRGRLLDGSVDEGRWLLVDLTSLDPRVAPIIGLTSGINDPSMTLLTLYGATRVLGVSDEVLDGLPVRRYTLNIQLDAALDVMPDEFKSGYAYDLEALARAQVEPQYTAEVWVGEDGLVHRIEYTQELGPEMGGGSILTTADFTDFGLPLDLDYPPTELITPIEDVNAPPDPLPRA